MSISLPCPSCSQPLYLPEGPLMARGGEAVMCRHCRFKFAFDSGRFVRYECQSAPPDHSIGGKVTVMNRHCFRLQKDFTDELVWFEFRLPELQPMIQCAEGDLLLLVFDAKREKLLALRNQSTGHDLPICSPRKDAAQLGQLSGLAAGVCCFSLLLYFQPMRKITAAIPSVFVSLGIGALVHRRLLPRERDAKVVRKLGTIQALLDRQHDISAGIGELLQTRASGRALINQFMALKQRLSLEPEIDGRRVGLCDRAIALVEKRSVLVEEQIAGTQRVLNIIEVDLLASHLIEQLPENLEFDLLKRIHHLDLIAEQIQTLSEEINAGRIFQLDEI